MAKKRQKSDTIQNIKYVFKNSFEMDKGLWGLILLLAVTEAVYSLLPGYFLKEIIDLITNKTTENILLVTCSLMGIILAITFLSRTYINHNLWWRIAKNRLGFMNKRIKATGRVPYSFFEIPEQLDVLERAIKATEGSNNGIQAMISGIQRFMIYTFQIVLSLLILSHRSLWLIIAVLLIQYSNTKRLTKMRKINKERILDPMTPFTRREEYLKNVMQDYTYGKDIRMLGIQGWLLDKYKAINDKIHTMVKKSNLGWLNHDLGTNGLEMLQEVIIYGWLIISMLVQKIDVSEFVLYSKTIHVLSDGFYNFFRGISDIQYASVEVSDFCKFMKIADEEATGNKGEMVPKNAKMNFEFENVSFKYPGQEVYAVQNLNIKIEEGSTLGIVGLNGAGKSTFVKLLMGLYETTEGQIKMDGVNIRKYNRNEYFQLFSPLFQDGQIYAFPCIDNIVMGDENRDITLCKCAVEKASATEFVERLPRGIDTDIFNVIAEDGVELSGGEKQKICLARALYKNAPVLILDEPTAAYDALSEQLFFEKFQEVKQSKTCIYITHRLSSAFMCDAIAVFENGEIVEYGTPAELLAQKGKFSKLYKLQAANYSEN